MAHPMLKQHLKTYFGFDSFLKGQESVIQKIVDHQSAAAIFPTGAGKSLCYQLPAMLLPGMTLVVSPLLSLMKDQLDFLRSKGIPAARLDSSLEKNEYHAVLEDARKGVLKILMISVERFKNEAFRFHLEKMKVSLLVIDEAHCISEWGHNFRPEYLNLPAYQQEFGINQVLLLTATATSNVIDDMCAKFNLDKDNVLITGFYRKNLYLQVSPTAASNREKVLLQRIREEPQAPTIVYVTLQKTAELLAQMLCDQQIDAQAYHAGMKSEQREQIQNAFMQGSLSCVVATIAFGMGIDKKDIRRVIHYDLPKSIEHYSQEIGRSGRDGQTSWCEVLANRDNIHVLENFIYGDTPEKAAIQHVLELIKENIGFIWEVKMVRLSSESNIRLLPLKTLLVYLAMEKIIRPRLTYFEEYTLKYIQEPEKIIDHFQGERRQFVETIMANSHTKKVWTTVDIPGILNNYTADRQRIILALEYFEDQNWIEMQPRQSVEVYDILNQNFEPPGLTQKMNTLFKNKEKIEIKRIHQMVEFFESDTCISKKLAGYFGERLDIQRCGHCSHCKSGAAKIKHTSALKSLAEYDFNSVSEPYLAAVGNSYRTENLTKFLCGIHTPMFARLKLKQLPSFGLFRNHPFLEVKQWIETQTANREQ
jgi:ATP-dependent DNA helicase RecQ